MKEAIDLLRKEINPINGSLHLSREAAEALIKTLDEMSLLIDGYESIIQMVDMVLDAENNDKLW